MKLIFALICISISLNTYAQNSKNTADMLFAKGNFTKAIEAYKSIKNLDEVYDKIAKAYIAIGNYGKGLEYYKKALTAHPEDALLKYEYAQLLTKTKNYEVSNQLFRDLIKTDILNPNYHYELGLVLEKQRDTTSLDAYKTTYNLDSTHQKAIFKIAKHSLQKRKFEDAHKLIDKGLESYDQNIELISLKAQAYYHQEYYTHSVVWFKKLLELGEASEFIHEKLSLSYAENSDYEDAIYHRKEALKYNPYDANAIFVIGTYYERLNNFEMAEEYVSNALKIKDVSLSHEYQRLGTILNRQKKYEKAIKAFQKSLKEDPSNIMSEFFLIRTKDEFYADIDSKIKLYEDYLKKKEKSPFKTYAETRLKELKQEKFIEQD
ncbi:tetratricopeptide repeat protein [Winogradskyella pulchriflava]|uniref:Tetratricopeptide repeat protein n=1 Tax=Winogradskyella pulchriflava TaxID=1110688 RepID=A0ABV6Q4B5_9FLAO